MFTHRDEAFLTDALREQLIAALGSNYSLDRELTGGGMSRVFVAQEKALGRTVVVKVLREELAAGMNRERFRREIMLAAQLHHPHVVPLLNAGEQGELLWYTMPFVEGESLRDEIRRGREFKTRDVIRLLHDMLDALAYAHSRGVVHRDIKPGNILRHGNHSLVTDFGVAKALSAARGSSGTTSAGMAIGTPAYMAPEQLAADPKADHRLDLYAAGLVAYEAITHTQPFAAASPAETLAAQLTRMPTPLREVRPDLPGPLASLITRLLAKNPDERPQSAAAAIEELDSFTTPVEVSAASQGRKRDNRVALGVAVGVVLAFSLFAILKPKAKPSAEPDTTRGLVRGDSGVPRTLTTAPETKAKAPPKPDSTKSKESPKPAPKTSTVGSAADAKAPAAIADMAKQAAALAQSVSANRTKVAPVPAPTGPLKRVAVPPVRIQSAQPNDTVGAATRALRDSLNKALVAAGYATASDADLLELLSSQGLENTRQISLGKKIGAVVAIDVYVRGDAIQVQPQVLDIWRNQTMGERVMVDRNRPGDIMGAINAVLFSLSRVSWRSEADEKRAVVFALDNQFMLDTTGTLVRPVEDSVRSVITTRMHWKLTGDSATRMLKDAQERRSAALRLGAGVSIATSMFRGRGDTVSLRISVRDMSEDAVLPVMETKISRSNFDAGLGTALERLAAQLATVNWGPKRAR